MASHVNHHTSQHYNLATALRQTWTGGIAGTKLLWLLADAARISAGDGGHPEGISLVYQYWIHTEAIKKDAALVRGGVQHALASPRPPRPQPALIDLNYAGILIIWDWMFGTFVPELDEEPCRYGVVHNLGDFNIFRVAYEWMAIGKDSAGRARSARWSAICSARLEP